jgi:hypothetical protein
MPRVPMEKVSLTPMVLNRKQVGASVPLVPHRGDPNLRIVEVDIVEADTVEHDLRGTLRLGLNDACLGLTRVKVMAR